MSERLKRCSACGGDNIKSDYGVYAKCLDCGIELPVVRWQSRPLEDTLREQLEDIKAERGAVYDLLIVANKQLEIAVEALKKIREQCFPHGVPDAIQVNKTLAEIEKAGKDE
jgi:hypothetical protein